MLVRYRRKLAEIKERKEYEQLVVISSGGVPDAHPSVLSSPFAAWNKGPQLVMRNCFAFAANALGPDLPDLRSGEYRVTIPAPGWKGCKFVWSHDPKSLRDSLIADGFVFMRPADQKQIKVPSGHYLVAAYSSWNGSSYDFHFYRRHEESGIWYHKFWDAPVTDKDGGGLVISDPQQAFRFHNSCEYRHFAGFFLAPNEGIPIKIEISETLTSRLVNYARRPKTESRFAPARSVPAIS